MNLNKLSKPLLRVLFVSIVLLILLVCDKIVLCRNVSSNARLIRQKAKEHLEEVKIIGECSIPKPELIYITDPIYIFNPRATVLHRCSNRSGCCANMDHSCQAVDTENVTLYFFVTGQSPKSTTVQCLRMINHTKCGCVKIGDITDDDLYHRSQNVFEFTECPAIADNWSGSGVRLSSAQVINGRPIKSR